MLDGAARDIDALRDLGMPVFAQAATPAGPFKHGPFRRSEATAVGGVCVFPVVAVVAVVARHAVDETVARAGQLAVSEEAKRVVNAQPIR